MPSTSNPGPMLAVEHGALMRKCRLTAVIVDLVKQRGFSWDGWQLPCGIKKDRRLRLDDALWIFAPRDQISSGVNATSIWRLGKWYCKTPLPMLRNHLRFFSGVYLARGQRAHLQGSDTQTRNQSRQWLLLSYGTYILHTLAASAANVSQSFR